MTCLAAAAWAQLPEGPGKTETEKACSQCHELERAISLRQDRDGWNDTIQKMASMGAKMSDADIQAIGTYLAAHYGADVLPPININKAKSIDLESGLSLKRSEATAIIDYRTKNGPFKSFDDLKKVPGIDIGKIEAKKDRLAFGNEP